ncbi:hypothetical protein [Baaleninema sp.]|uniref:hypothetical protein n=1 Tax=Baaleninema sp. TaxID=3101197 RepID=UPI003D00B8F6
MMTVNNSKTQTNRLLADCKPLHTLALFRGFRHLGDPASLFTEDAVKPFVKRFFKAGSTRWEGRSLFWRSQGYRYNSELERHRIFDRNRSTGLSIRGTSHHHQKTPFAPVERRFFNAGRSRWTS